MIFSANDAQFVPKTGLLWLGGEWPKIATILYNLNSG